MAFNCARIRKEESWPRVEIRGRPRPPYFRLPARDGWGRLAHGPATGGWQSLAMVHRYSHLAPDHLRTAVERLVSSSERVELGQSVDSAVGGAEVDRRGGVQHTDTVTRRGGRARLKASDSKSDRGASPSGVQILSPPPI